MTTGTPRGRRDNGLEAAAYAPAADLDPRVGEHLLDVLGIAGIAAYLQPAADLHPISRSTTLPSRPTDRLWVDQAKLAEAKILVEQLDDVADVEFEPPQSPSTPGARRRRRSDLDVDAAWEQIVASWDSEPFIDEPSRAAVLPAQPSLFDPIEGLDVPFDPRQIVRDDDEEGYTPPPPPPLPRASRYTVLAILLVVSGLTVFFWPDLLPIDQTAALLVGIAALLSGFGMFVWRLRDEAPEDTDPDDGAVV